MARFKANEADNYGGQGGGGFFSIQNDKEVKQVRFMYDGVDDIEGMSVHKVEVDGKDRYVNCLREYNQPVDDCPFCREKKFAMARLFIPVYNIDEDAVQVWDRGKTMFSKMTSLCSRYATKNNLVNNIFEIERNGKPKDTNTKYEIYQIDKDDTEIDDLGELPKILGGLVLDKTAEDMEYYLEEGEFPPVDDEEDEKPARRNSRDSRDSKTSEKRGSERRTPATSRRKNEDSF
jgi:hypothetical protein